MKLSKQLIDYIEGSDVYYIIAIKGDEHVTSIQSRYKEPKTTSYHIVTGMLGSIQKGLTKGQLKNAVPLIHLVHEATKQFPELFKKSKQSIFEPIDDIDDI